MLQSQEKGSAHLEPAVLNTVHVGSNIQGYTHTLHAVCSCNNTGAEYTIGWFYLTEAAAEHSYDLTDASAIQRHFPVMPW